MKKLIALTLIGAITAAMPAFADSVSEDQQDVQADMRAIHKDNLALKKDRARLARDRAAKADAKANGNYGQQAGNSLAIGADKTAIKEKEAEKNVDKKILNHAQNDMNRDTSQQDYNANSPSSGQ